MSTGNGCESNSSLSIYLNESQLDIKLNKIDFGAIHFASQCHFIVQRLASFFHQYFFSSVHRSHNKITSKVILSKSFLDKALCLLKTGSYSLYHDASKQMKMHPIFFPAGFVIYNSSRFFCRISFQLISIFCILFRYFPLFFLYLSQNFAPIVGEQNGTNKKLKNYKQQRIIEQLVNMQ